MDYHIDPVFIHDIDYQFVIVRIWIQSLMICIQIFRHNGLYDADYRIFELFIGNVLCDCSRARFNLEISKQVYVIMIYGFAWDFAMLLIYWYSLLELYIRRYFFPNSINSRTLIYVKASLEYKHPVLDYDFVITTKGNLYSINEDKFEESQGKFIFTEIYFSDRKEKIHFKTDKFNYYLVGNKLDHKFIVYFMKKYYSLYVDKYTVKFVDNDVNSGEFSNSEIVTFSSSGYTIHH